jgi:hypothetical protein
MTVFSKNNYEDQDEGRIMKAARKQQYIMFPVHISFLNDELRTELGMKSRKESKRPESHPTKACARARVRCLNTEPNYYYCPITLVMS